MRFYKCTSFKGHYPVGVAAVVVAPTKMQARTLLIAELERYGLKQDVPMEDIHEIDKDNRCAHILTDGNY